MRVAQVIYALHPDGGGLPKSAAAIAAGLAESGVDCALIFCGMARDVEAAKAAYGSFPGFDQVRLIVLPPGGFHFFTAQAVTHALAEFAPDLVHTHGLWEPMLAHAQRYARHKRIPYVVFPQSMLHPWQSRQHRIAKWILKNLLGWKKRWRKAAFIQVLSEAEACHWRALGMARIRKIPNGIFAEEDLGSETALPQVWGGHPFVLSLARLHPQKSPDLLIRAFAVLAEKSDDLQLVLAGPDYGMKEKLQKQVVSLGLTQRVHFPGTLGGAEKWAALHRCACFCLPSRAEGFSLALLEAALAGVPMVISESCYFRRLVEVGAAVQADLTVTDLAEKLEQMLKEAEGKGDAGRQLVLEAYTWENIVDQLMEAYKESGA